MDGAQGKGARAEGTRKIQLCKIVPSSSHAAIFLRSYQKYFSLTLPQQQSASYYGYAGQGGLGEGTAYPIIGSYPSERPFRERVVLYFVVGTERRQQSTKAQPALPSEPRPEVS